MITDSFKDIFAALLVNVNFFLMYIIVGIETAECCVPVTLLKNLRRE